MFKNTYFKLIRNIWELAEIRRSVAVATGHGLDLDLGGEEKLFVVV